MSSFTYTLELDSDSEDEECNLSAKRPAPAVDHAPKRVATQAPESLHVPEGNKRAAPENLPEAKKVKTDDKLKEIQRQALPQQTTTQEAPLPDLIEGPHAGGR